MEPLCMFPESTNTSSNAAPHNGTWRARLSTCGKHFGNCNGSPCKPHMDWTLKGRVNTRTKSGDLCDSTAETQGHFLECLNTRFWGHFSLLRVCPLFRYGQHRHLEIISTFFLPRRITAFNIKDVWLSLANYLSSSLKQIVEPCTWQEFLHGG